MRVLRLLGKVGILNPSAARGKENENRVSAHPLTWMEEHDKAHPQSKPRNPDQRPNPGFAVPKDIFKWNNWEYVDKLDRIHRWNVGKQAPPYKIILVPSNRCNLKCPYCPNSHGRVMHKYKASEELSDGQWYSLVQEALDMGVKEFYVLGGGEPLLRKEMLLKIYQMIKDRDSENITELITNGFFFTEEDCELIAREKLINKMLFSVDGHTAEIHDLVRGVPGSWKRATDSIRWLHEYKRKYNKDKPVLHMNHIVTNQNYMYLSRTVELAHSLGVVELAIHLMREYEETQGNFDHLKLTPEQETEMFRELELARAIAAKQGVYLNVSMVQETKAKDESKPEDFIVGKELLDESSESSDDGNPLPHFRTFCYEPLYSIFIDPKGNANFCCTAGDSNSTQNVATRGLENIWYGSYLMAVKRGMLAGKSTPRCHNCGLYDMTHDLKRDMKKYVDSLLENGVYPESSLEALERLRSHGAREDF